MGTNEAERLIDILEGEFRAAATAADDLAASDLGFSLDQDVPLADVLLRDGGWVLVAGARVPIDGLGHDYVRAGNWLIPLARAVIELGNPALPGIEIDLFLGCLRRMARASVSVAVGVGARGYSGRITRCSTEHLFLEGARRAALPLTEVHYVRRAPEGSADGL